jgi:hypothetical protein
MSSGASNTRILIGMLFGLTATLIYYFPNLSSAQELEELPAATLDEQQIQDLRSFLNRSMESLKDGNITEAMTNLRIADDQLRILED